MVKGVEGEGLVRRKENQTHFEMWTFFSALCTTSKHGDKRKGLIGHPINT